MKKFILIFLFSYTFIFSQENSLTQISTINALLAGSYDGIEQTKALLNYGDFGIGTFHKLDGEMLILDNQIYQIRANGKPYKDSLSQTTPFATVVKFKSDIRYKLENVNNFESLLILLEDKIKDKNKFYAFKINGVFNSIKTRSIKAQEKPYNELKDVVKKQSYFNTELINGTLVGFYMPEFVKGLNVPGFHFHFISDDEKFGGHVLELNIKNALVKIGKYSNFYMKLSEKENHYRSLNLLKDRSKELEKIEK